MLFVGRSVWRARSRLLCSIGDGRHRRAASHRARAGWRGRGLESKLGKIEADAVEEMNNNLSDYDKYEALLAKQKALYKKALPYLMKADTIKRSEGTIKTLLNMYDTLEMIEEADALRPIYKKMRGQ